MKKIKFIFIYFIFAFAALSFLALYFFTDNRREATNEDFLNYRIEKKKNKKPSYGMPDKATLWYYQQRAYPLGYIPENWRVEAYEHIKKNNEPIRLEKNNNALQWTQLGPGNIGGRIRAIVVHPQNSNIIFIGAVSGGVWKTTNGGTSWFPCDDYMDNIAVCALAIDPDNPNIIYAGTGEGFFNLDAIRGEGIFKSTDQGATWSRLSSTLNDKFYFVNKLEFDKQTKRLWAATRKGLFYSTNGGSSWTTALANSNNYDVHCVDVEIAYTSPSTTVYAAFGIFGNGTVYRSTDGGNTFDISSPKIQGSSYGRIEVAVSNTNPQIAFVSIMSASNYGTASLKKTTDGGNTWTDITVPGPSASGAQTYTGQQAWYNNILYVDPSNSNIFYAGGIDFWKSTNGGINWTQKSNWYPLSGYQYIHADHHAIAFDPQNLNVMYIGTDGGIFKSTNKGETWASLNNNLFITQFYYGAVDPSQSKYYGGTQDNGTLKSTGSTSWIEILGGDGGATEVDFVNPNTIYMEYVNLAIFKTTNGGSSYFKAMNGIPTGSNYWDGTTDRVLFIAPFVMDPNNSQTLYAGTYRIFKTTNGAANWTAVSGDLTNSSDQHISTIAVAKGNSNVVYVGTTNGRVLVSTNAGANWTLVNSGLPNLYVTRVAIYKQNPSIAVATFSGYSIGAKVYKTTNSGQSWTNISGNLPNIPANCAFINPENHNNIVIGMDLGVFVTTNNGTSWERQVQGMANVAVLDLVFRESDSKLFAFTHGRGAFVASFGSSGGGGPTVEELAYDDGNPTGGYYWNNDNQGSAVRFTPTIQNAKVISGLIYITGVNAGSPIYKPIILSKNANNAPGSSLANIPNRTASTTNGWDEVDLSSFNIIVNNEFFYGYLNTGGNRITFGYSQTNNGRAWDYDGTNWSPLNETYYMRVKIQSTATEAEIENIIPEDYALEQNYPNPFNPETTITFKLPRAEKTKLIVYSSTGQKIATLVDNELNPGIYRIKWNGKDDFGKIVASGVYIYKLEAGKFTKSLKMNFVK